MSPTVPQAVQSCHDMLLWLIPQLDKFPRVRQFAWITEEKGTGRITNEAWRLVRVSVINSDCEFENNAQSCLNRNRFMVTVPRQRSISSAAIDSPRWCC